MTKKDNIVGLYNHNIKAYEKIKEGYNNSDVVGIVHATGTGKSYVGMQLVYDNNTLKTLWLVPNNSIIEHIIKSINDNPNLNMDVDFPNLEFKTYRNLVNMSFKELSDIDVDLLVLDEFHHIGAPVWGERVETIIDTHPNVKVFGMTAYTVRDRGTPYERDMALSEGDELFSNNIVSRYDLCDAMIDGVIPIPIYKSSYVKLTNMSDDVEQRIKRLELSGRDCSEYKKVLNDIKRRIHEASGITKIIKNNVIKNGKYIYFCPSFNVAEENDVEIIKKEALSWFKEITDEENIIFYTSLSEMKDGGRANRDAFYDDVDLDGNDVSHKLRVMFAINQYNEGVHAPNIDGVIMGRGTVSDIVFFEQLGRALSVSGGSNKNKELYSGFPIEKLRFLCSEKKINYNLHMGRDALIKKLVAPVIIDLAGNIDFIKELEDNLKDRVKELREKGIDNLDSCLLSDAIFDLDIYELDLFNILLGLRNETDISWDEWFKIAEDYFLEYGNLEVSSSFITEKGYRLGEWIGRQRRVYASMMQPDKYNRYSAGRALTDEEIKKLESIGMIWNVLDNSWNKMYKLAQEYFYEKGNSMIPLSYLAPSGETLGRWVQKQRLLYRRGRLREERVAKLRKINMILEPLTPSWDEWYSMALEYFKSHGDLEITKDYKTNKGFKLGFWIINQRKKYKKNMLTEEEITKLKEIGMRFERLTYAFDDWYELAEAYFLEHGDLKVPFKYIVRGDKKLGEWVLRIRASYKEGKLSNEQIEKLKKIGMVFQVEVVSWDEWYDEAKSYYLEHGDLEVPSRYVTPSDRRLGAWINNQRKLYVDGKLSQDQIDRLLKIKMRFGKLELWEQYYSLAKAYFLEHGNLDIRGNYIASNGEKLGQWILVQRQFYKNGQLNDLKVTMLESIGMIWNTRTNKVELSQLIESNKVDIDENKAIIDHISVTEFRVKLAYLNDKRIKCVDDNGILHEIFSMSNLNMKAKYGVDLEELVNMYHKEKSKKKSK